MQTVVLNINDSVVDKFLWLLGHFNKNEVEILDFDESLEAELDKGFNSAISKKSHKEIFDDFMAKYANGAN